VEQSATITVTDFKCSIIQASPKNYTVSAGIFLDWFRFYSFIKTYFIYFITGRICRRQLCQYCFYSRGGFGCFRPTGATRCTDQNEIWQGGALLPAKFHLDQLRSRGLRSPKLKKNGIFTNIITPKGRVPCTIFKKFTGFMRLLSLHNGAKFGCFISINDNYKQFTAVGAFSTKFSTTPSGKIIDGTQKSFRPKMMARPPLSPCKISWKSHDACRRERTKCDVFQFVTGRICRRQLCRYCFYSRPIFGFFAPQGQHVAPIKVKFGN